MITLNWKWSLKLLYVHIKWVKAIDLKLMLHHNRLLNFARQ